MDSLYRENILDHYKHPRNFGPLTNPDVSHEENNPFCGDRIVMGVKFQISKFKFQIIKNIKFHGEGCAISMASASMLTELVKGKTIEEIKGLKKEDILNMLGSQLTPTRLKCALLPLEAMQKALALINKG